MTDNNKAGRVLRSSEWFGSQNKNRFMYRSWMKIRAFPNTTFITARSLGYAILGRSLLPAIPTRPDGCLQLYLDDVLQADEGCDFDFLVGGRSADVPAHSH